MNPVVMLLIIVANLGAFAWSSSHRMRLLFVGRPAFRLDKIAARIEGVLRYAFWQEKMDYYQPAGGAHKLIFTGFIVLLLRSIILWGRGFSPTFNAFIFQPWLPLGQIYEFMKDIVATGVIGGVSVFVYYRAIKPQKRMTLSTEGLVILGIIFTMMVADMIYDGAGMALHARQQYLCLGANKVATEGQCAAIATIAAPLGPEPHTGFVWYAPAGSSFANLFATMSPGLLIFLAHAGFWTHATLVLIFLNILPYSKHFHIITAIPNVFLRDQESPGRLRPMAENAEKLMEVVGAVAEMSD